MSESTSVQCWELRSVGEPLARAERTVEELGANEALIRIAGCGVCHTDIGFMYDGVRTKHALPLTLGHEISGTVERAGAEFAHLVGKSVVAPAVIPCGSCELCKKGRGMICKKQIFPGNDVHGGFASHAVVPAHGLCVVDDDKLAKSGLELSDLSVLGDAISTPYQAILRSELAEGDVAIVVGVGGVGSFAVQIANAMGAHVIGIDIDDTRLGRAAEYGASHTLNVRDLDPKAVRKSIRGYVKEKGLPDTCWKVFETSGTAPGQQLAYGLLTFGAFLGVVGYTMDTINVRLANLMAFDAKAEGNWGCLPEHYPAVVDMVLDGRVKIKPFIEARPMSQINETMKGLHAHEISLRPVLVPDFE